jgi:hypothetical protein
MLEKTIPAIQYDRKKAGVMKNGAINNISHANALKNQ